MTQSPSMTVRPAGSGKRPDHEPPGPDAAITRRLLVWGAIAGPLFVIVALAQALTRPGFDLTRDAISLLENGSWGWVQVTSFIVTGLLFIVAAAGLRRTLRTGPGRTWIPRLVTVVGAGLAGGGVFHPDPSSGFPPGTPAGASAVASWHGVLHMVCGSAAFLALIAVCFVLARRYSSRRHRGWAACSRAAGGLCAAGIAASGAPHGSLSLFIGVSIAMIWVALTSARLITEQTKAAAAGARAPRRQPAAG